MNFYNYKINKGKDIFKESVYVKTEYHLKVWL